MVLSGGSGTRLWPLSRETDPKQFHALSGQGSMLQQTLRRVVGPAALLPAAVICNERDRFIVAEQLREAGCEDAMVVLEPVARGTASAAIVAALLAAERGALALLLPSDHAIDGTGDFAAVVAQAVPAAEAGQIVAFGAMADRPETGYGYIRTGAQIDGPVCRIDEFIEKPTRERAEALIAAGGCLWNCGILLFDPAIFLGEAERLEPAAVAACRRALHTARRDPDFLRLDAAAYGEIRGQSVDYAIMERTQRAAVMPFHLSWSDLGSWSALWNIADKDPEGTVAVGDVLALDTANSYLRAEGIALAAVGVQNLVVVATKDAVLVAPLTEAQRVRELVDELARRGRPEATAAARVRRPWGWYETTDHGEGFLVKRLMVLPQHSLSLQLHHHRSEHWVVVDGTAEIQRDGEVFRLAKNESTYIPVGVRHRLHNPEQKPLYLVEVQCGAHLSEEDIVRFEDNYGRSGAPQQG